jgi:hypothetical protein
MDIDLSAFACLCALTLVNGKHDFAFFETQNKNKRKKI